MEILNTYYKLATMGEWVMFVSIAILIVLVIIGGLSLDDKKYKVGVSTFLIAVIILTTLIINYNKLPENTYHEVIFSNLGEFNYEKYEIVSQKGKILTIKEVR